MDRLNKSPEEILRERAARPQPHEVERYASRWAELPAGRLGHVKTCGYCSGLVVGLKPPPLPSVLA